jgi:hypothetical protein
MQGMATIDFSALTDGNARFEKLCNKGMRKEKAARLASMSRNHVTHRATFSKYDKWTTDELYRKAVDEGIEGCAHMNKRALIDALREH